MWNRFRRPAQHSLALFFRQLRCVSAVQEFSLEELHGYHSKDELKQDVDDHDVEHIFQGVDDAVEHSLQKRAMTVKLTSRRFSTAYNFHARGAPFARQWHR